MIAQKATFQAFVKLGSFLSEFLATKNNSDDPQLQAFQEILLKAEAKNAWFTSDNLEFSLQQWANDLTEENLSQWLASYQIDGNTNPKTIAVIMAGNIPLVGFHDFLCVLLSGNKVLAKLSSNDNLILPFLSKVLVGNNPELESYIQFTEEKLQDFDAVIATGSNNMYG